MIRALVSAWLDGLAAHPDLPFVIHSQTRPWRGTFGDVLDLSRRAASGLVASGVRPGDVVTFQTPNWLEGAVTFYAAAFVGAVVAPIVHIYGTRETSYILNACQPKVHVTASRFGHQDFLANLESMPDIPGMQLIVLDEPARPAVSDSTSCWRRMPSLRPCTVDPGSPALVGWTSGTTASPKGVVHSHQTVCAEIAQLGATSPPTERPSLMANPISHAIGMLGALLIPVDRGKAVHLLDQWDPGVVLELIDVGGSGRRRRGPLFPHQPPRSTHSVARTTSSVCTSRGWGVPPYPGRSWSAGPSSA